MKYQAIVKAAAAVLPAVFICAGAYAQSGPATLVDTAPLPAEDRNSLGAVVLMDDPVIAQREMMDTMMARSAVDTRVMGAGPARVIRQEQAKEDLMVEKIREAMEFYRRGPAWSTPK